MSASRTPQTMLRVGKWFHLFFVLRLLGRGGSAEVYLVLLQGKEYALKVPRYGLSLSTTQLKRFRREAEILVRVRHRHVIDVLDHGVSQGIPWIRMEYLRGVDLREAMSRLGALSVGLVAAWLTQAAYGVQQCHELGFVHRDIKPENIFVTRDNVVKLLDWGIAKLRSDLTTRQTDQMNAWPIGTAPYMAPEQILGCEVTAASDVYALGMIQVEMLLGRHPLLRPGESYDAWAMLMKQMHEAVPPLSMSGLPESYSRVAERALSKNPLERQANGLAFADELLRASEAHLRDHPEEHSRPGEPSIAQVLHEAKLPPSFGTGPIPMESQTGARSLVPTAPLSYDTEPMPAPPVHEPDTDERAADPIVAPPETGRFDTSLMPLELRDPSSVRALAALSNQPCVGTSTRTSDVDAPEEAPTAEPSPVGKELRAPKTGGTVRQTSRRLELPRLRLASMSALVLYFVVAVLLSRLESRASEIRPMPYPDRTVDAGPMDAGAVDVGPVDAGFVDAGPVDVGPVDAGFVDAGAVVAVPVDAGPVDAGTVPPPPTARPNPQPPPRKRVPCKGLDWCTNDAECCSRVCRADLGVCGDVPEPAREEPYGKD